MGSCFSMDSGLFSHECFEQIAKTIVLLEAFVFFYGFGCVFTRMLRADWQNHRSARSIRVFLWIRVVFHTNASSRLPKPSFCSKHSRFSKDSGCFSHECFEQIAKTIVLLEAFVFF